MRYEESKSGKLVNEASQTRAQRVAYVPALGTGQETPAAGRELPCVPRINSLFSAFRESHPFAGRSTC